MLSPRRATGCIDLVVDNRFQGPCVEQWADAREREPESDGQDGRGHRVYHERQDRCGRRSQQTRNGKHEATAAEGVRENAPRRRADQRGQCH